jgi:hypothetical protein
MDENEAVGRYRFTPFLSRRTGRIGVSIFEVTPNDPKRSPECLWPSLEPGRLVSSFGGQPDSRLRARRRRRQMA